jgi:hypothetical protein
MISPASHNHATAAGLRRQLWSLEGERIEALAAGLGSNELYMRDIEDEISDVTEAFVGHAVTEIALLRAGFATALQG